MRRKARSAGKKNTLNKNEANAPSKAAALIESDNTPVKPSSTTDNPSTSQTPTRRLAQSWAKDGQQKTVAPSAKVSAAPAASKKATSAENRTQIKKLAPPKKVVLAKKAIVAKTTSAAKKDITRKKILTKVKMVKATKTSRTNQKMKLPIRAGQSKVYTLSLDFFIHNKY